MDDPQNSVDETKIRILLHEHEMIRNEVIADLGFHKKGITYLTLVISGLLATAGWMVANQKITASLPLWKWVALVTTFPLINLVCAYFFFDALHTQYSLILTHARSRMIEKQIAEEAGPNLMIWEQFAGPFFSKCCNEGVPNPNYVHAILTFCIMLAVMVVFPIMSLWLIWGDAGSDQIPSAHAILIGAGAFSMLLPSVCAYYAWQIGVKMRPRAYRRLIRRAFPFRTAAEPPRERPSNTHNLRG